MTDAALPSVRSKGFKASMFEFAAATLVGAVIGGAFSAFGPIRASDSARSTASATTSTSSTVYDLQPIVTNLGSPSETWVRLEGSIIFDPRETSHPEAEGAKISADVLAYLRNLSLKQLEGPIGLEDLRQDLNERAITRSAGKVREFIIRTLVVQ